MTLDMRSTCWAFGIVIVSPSLMLLEQLYGGAV
jgi:hypothetical protein